jgi:tRNA nucleotidyltransferase/poly(A) polymerase
MKIFTVGGAVRDTVMGVTPKDIDYVVLNSSPAQMLAAGFEQVGTAFPVFLKNGCEYALARTERKTGNGYHGFAVDIENVTLEEDLARRDLTVNAIAMDESGNFIDPYGGIDDIRRKVIRHVGPAFADDPLRVIRVARFMARWPDFTLAPETRKLCEQVVADGHLDTLSQERIWLEVEKAMAGATWRFFDVLADVGALETNVLSMFKRRFGEAQKLHMAFPDKDYRLAMMLRDVKLHKNQLVGLSVYICRLKHLAELQWGTPEQVLISFQQARVFSSDAAWQHLLPILKFLVPDKCAMLTNAFTSAKKMSAMYIEQSQGIPGAKIGEGLRAIRLSCIRAIT